MLGPGPTVGPTWYYVVGQTETLTMIGFRMGNKMLMCPTGLYDYRMCHIGATRNGRFGRPSVSLTAVRDYELVRSLASSR